MLTPEELEVLPDNIVKHFSDLETYIIADIIRRIKETGTITETALAQIKTLQSMNVFLSDIEEAIQETLHISNMELDRMYDEVLKRNREFNENLASKMDLLLPENQYFQMEAYTEAIKRQTKDDFYNLTQSMGFAVKVNGKTMFKPIAQYYQDTLDNTQIKIVSGGVDYNTAIKEAVDQLTNSGLRTVDYASGWSNQIEVAVRRATLTGVHQVTGYIAQQTANELGTDLVEVSAHIGARDKGIGPMNHKSWQGKVYSIMGDTEKYPNLARVTGYGTGEGLKGWNCRHSFYPFVEGASTRAYTDEQLKNIDPPDFEYEGKKYTAYEATQKQRELESAIRNSKRKLLGYQEAGLKDAFVTESIRLNRLRKYYQDFSNKAGLKTQLERTQVAGFGKSISAKAASAARMAEKAKEASSKAPDVTRYTVDYKQAIKSKQKVENNTESTKVNTLSNPKPKPINNVSKTDPEPPKPDVITNTPQKPEKPTFGYKDVTDEWLKNATPNSHEIKDANIIQVDGKIYQVDGKDIKLEHNEHEKEIANVIEEKLGGELWIMPRFVGEQYKNMQMSDYVFRGGRYDLKTLKNSISKNAVYNRLNESQKQSNNFVLDITNNPLGLNEILRQTKKIYDSYHARGINVIIIIQGNNIVKIYERK